MALAMFSRLVSVPGSLAYRGIFILMRISVSGYLCEVDAEACRLCIQWESRVV